MKRIGLTVQAHRQATAAPTARTGCHCPLNGLWRPVGSAAEAVFIFEGSLMPAHAGLSTEWVWVDSGA